MLDSDFQYGGWILLAAVLLILYAIGYVCWLVYQNSLIKKMAQNGVLLEVTLEKDTEAKHLAVEQMWAAFHSGLYIP